ncbi:MAG: hypothetical protein ACPLW7_05245 [Minisyncoccia bacterium]
MLYSEPEILSKKLLENIMRLKRDISFMHEERNYIEIDESLNNIIRKLYILNLTFKYYVIAIGGAQGSGKTTFIKNIYEIPDEWLEANEGRGEKMPLWILESDESTPLGGYVEIVDNKNNIEYIEKKDVDKNEFKSILKGEHKELRFPVLYVPRKYFPTNLQMGFLLLPGYEIINENNKLWQELLRQSLIYSKLHVIITDQTLMANQMQKKIQEDYKKNVESDFIIVISKTENKSDNDKNELVSSAKELYECNEDRILLSGVGDKKYLDTICSDFKNKIKNSKIYNHQSYANKIKFLDDISNEILVIISSIRAIQNSNKNKDLKDKFEIKEILGEYDSAYLKTKKIFDKKLEDVLSQYSKTIKKDLMEKYEEEDAGLLNKISNLFETSDKKELRYIKNIEEAFERNKEDFANGFIKSIGYTIQQSTPRIMQNKIKSFFNSEVNNNDSNTNLPDRIAVSDDSLLPKNFKHHLSILFNPNLQFNQEDLRGVEDTVKFLPLTIYLFALNEFQKRCQLNDIEIPRKTEGNLQLNNVFSQFSNFLKEQGALSKILMAAFAIDVADGGMNSIPKLLTGLGLSLGAANIATVATVAVGFIYIALMETRNLDLERRSDIKKSVDHIIDVYKEKITDTFDEINQTLRETLLSNLEAFYKIDDNLYRDMSVSRRIADIKEIIISLKESKSLAYAAIK